MDFLETMRSWKVRTQKASKMQPPIPIRTSTKRFKDWQQSLIACRIHFEDQGSEFAICGFGTGGAP